MVTYREIVPGFQVFDCDRLRASLSPAACADNWRTRKCIACDGCEVGQVHAGAGRRSATSTGYKVAQKCIRCGRSSFKLVGYVLCVSCYNRQREATIWQNARNKAPVKAGSRLRWIHALIRVQPEVMHGSPYMGRTYRRPHHPGIPSPMQYGKDGTFWVEAIMIGADEFNTYLGRVLPDTEIIDMDVGPPLVELHSGEPNQNRDARML